MRLDKILMGHLKYGNTLDILKEQSPFKNCFKNIYFHKDISSMLFEGLAYRGIVYLLKERIERDEKI